MHCSCIGSMLRARCAVQGVLPGARCGAQSKGLTNGLPCTACTACCAQETEEAPAPAERQTIIDMRGPQVRLPGGELATARACLAGDALRQGLREAKLAYGPDACLIARWPSPSDPSSCFDNWPTGSPTSSASRSFLASPPVCMVCRLCTHPAGPPGHQPGALERGGGARGWRQR